MKKLFTILLMAFGTFSSTMGQQFMYNFTGKFEGRNLFTTRCYPSFRIDSLIFSKDSISIFQKTNVTKYSLNNETTTFNLIEVSKLQNDGYITLEQCYWGLPKSRNANYSLDLLTGDEVVTCFERDPFGGISQGMYSAEKPVISHWDSIYQTITNCYWFQENIRFDGNYTEEQKNDYIAQADFLIAYCHYLLIRCYGPIMLVKSSPRYLETNYYVGGIRESLDNCVNFVVEKLDRAASTLKSNPSSSDHNVHFNYPTPLVAQSIKAKLLLYVASPLFNGTPDVAPLFGKNGYDPNNPIADLVPANYDPTRWEKARDAALVAIQAAQAVGHKLYYDASGPSSIHPADPLQRRLRYAICDHATFKNELIWGDGREEGKYGLQKKSIPYWNNGAWNGIAPTGAMLNRFYTKNGLPIEYDATFSDNLDDLYNRAVANTDPSIGKVYPASSSGVRMPNMVGVSVNREPRFYAWIAFHNGYYEVKGDAGEDAANRNNPYFKDNKAPIGTEKPSEAGRLYTMFGANNTCGCGSGTTRRTNNYSLTGFLNKKGVHPDCTASGGASVPPFYHWPLIRLADLYLMYAEAAIECGNLNDARPYIDSVRLRAGLNKLEEVYAPTNTNLRPAYQNWHTRKEGMRDIVRRERMVEMYLENQNFWDMRRWLLAGDQVDGKWGELKTGYFNTVPFGCDIDGLILARFANKTITSVIRQFEAPKNYLLPIPIEVIKVNQQLKQNPGY